MNGASFCPECGSRMHIKATNHGGEITFRIAECDCGERWELEERRVRRLKPAGSRVQPCTAVQSHAPPPAAANPPAPAGGFGGDLSGVPTLIQDSGPSSQATPDQTRARSNRDAEYPTAFLAVWAGTGKRGSKFNAHKAWKAQGSPSWGDVEPVWRAYMLSQRPADGYVKDLSSWLNGRCHKQEWLPAAPKIVRRTDFNVRAAEEREDADLERRFNSHTGRTG